MYRRISLVDLLELPFNVIHTLYKNALLTAIAQREKEEREAKERAEQEEKERREAARENKRLLQRGPKTSAIPVKQQQTSTVQVPSQSSNAAETRMNDAAMSDFEDLIEGDF